MTGFEVLVLLLAVYAVAAPDPVTLTATRGAAGAMRAVAGMPRAGSRSTWPTSATSAKASPKRRGSGGGSAAAAAVRPAALDPAHPFGTISAAARAAAAGWRDGVRAAHERRAAGGDLVGRARRAVVSTAGWAGQAYGGVTNLAGRTAGLSGRVRRRRAEQAQRAANLDAAKASLTTDDPPPPAEPPPPPPPAEPVDPSARAETTDPSTPEPATAKERFFALRNSGSRGPIDQDGHAVTDERLTALGAIDQDSSAPAEVDTTTTDSAPAAEPTKGTPVSTTTLPTTELESLSAVLDETRTAAQAAEELADALSSLQAWASALPDRWSGTDWSTTDLDTAIAGVGDAVSPNVDPEALLAALQGVVTAAERARAVAEVADEVGATGNVERFRAS